VDTSLIICQMCNLGYHSVCFRDQTLQVIRRNSCECRRIYIGLNVSVYSRCV